MALLRLQSRSFQRVFLCAASRSFSSTRLNAASESDDYLERTTIPTYHFQDSLPRLPIPDLDKTMERFLRSATPLLKEEELASTRLAVSEFLEKEGPLLQANLLRRDRQEYTSFISKPWFDMYLDCREPLMLNMNPQLTLFDDAPKMTQDQRCASLLWSAARFYRTLTDKQLRPDIYHTNACMGGSGKGFLKFLNGKGGSAEFDRVTSLLPSSLSFYGAYAYGSYPLDMSQYQNLFESTRLPGLKKDSLLKSQGSRHVVVQRGNDFWEIEVLRADGRVVPHAQILAAVQRILSSPPSASLPLGALTAAHRTTWAKARAKLLEDPRNARPLAVVDSALFAVCLEDRTPTDAVDLNRLMLHGDGRNRWFDKSFQIIVTPTGKAAVMFEHSWGDGVAVVRFVNEMFADSVNTAPAEPVTAAEGPKRVEFELEHVARDIKSACDETDRVLATLDVAAQEWPEMSPTFIHSKKSAVDGTFQMLFQLAHWHMHGHAASTYESANTSAFKHGRTETIRSCTVQAKAMCQTFSRPSTLAEREEAFRSAVSMHSSMAKHALLGQGWDRHLFALKVEAKRAGMAVPAIFQDKAYNVLSEIILSTSTLKTPSLESGGFGPVGPKCYGIAYGSGTKPTGEEVLGVTVTSYMRDSRGFLDCLHRAVGEVREVLAARDV